MKGESEDDHPKHDEERNKDKSKMVKEGFPGINGYKPRVSSRVHRYRCSASSHVTEEPDTH